MTEHRVLWPGNGRDTARVNVFLPFEDEASVLADEVDDVLEDMQSSASKAGDGVVAAVSVDDNNKHHEKQDCTVEKKQDVLEHQVVKKSDKTRQTYGRVTEEEIRMLEAMPPVRMTSPTAADKNTMTLHDGSDNNTGQEAITRVMFGFSSDVPKSTSADLPVSTEKIRLDSWQLTEGPPDFSCPTSRKRRGGTTGSGGESSPREGMSRGTSGAAGSDDEALVHRITQQAMMTSSSSPLHKDGDMLTSLRKERLASEAFEKKLHELL